MMYRNLKFPVSRQFKRPSKKESKVSAFTYKDYITITLSAIALLTSFLGFYFSNLRIEDNLHAKVIDMGYPEGDTLNLKTVFINSGNRQAVLLIPGYTCADTSSDFDSSFSAPFDNREEFPLIIEPKQVKLLYLKLNVRDINYNDKVFQRGMEVISGDTVYTRYLEINYLSYDSNYELYDTTTGLEILVKVNKKKIISAEFLSDDLKPTDLFKQIEYDKKQ